MLAGAALAAGEFDFKNAVFDLTFDTKGGTVRKLLYKNTDWNAAGPKKEGNSFNDARLGQNRPEKTQFHENFSDLEYTLADWKTYRTTGWADVTFTVRGTVYTWLRMYKTYRIRTGNTLEVFYELVNTGRTPQPISFSTRWFFNRGDRENIYWMPDAKGIQKRKQQRYMFFSKLPPRSFLAVTDAKNDGLVIGLPADGTAGVMNWFIKGRSATTEYFSDEAVIPAGGKRTFTFVITFTEDTEKFIAQKKFESRPVKGAIPMMAEHLARQESRDYKIRTVRAESPKSSAYFDLKLKRQFKDSWRAVTLPPGIPTEKIAVFQLENGVPSFDRPVGYALNAAEDPRHQSLREQLAHHVEGRHHGRALRTEHSPGLRGLRLPGLP